MKNKLLEYIMQLSDINPFMRFAELQPSVVSKAPLKYAYDHRIFYVIDGNAKLILENGKYDLDAGTLLYLCSGTPYYFDGNVKVLVLNFDLTRDCETQKDAMRPKPRHSFKPENILENDVPRELEGYIIARKAFEVEARLQECITNFRFPTAVSDALTSATIKEVLCYAVQNTDAVSKKIPDIVEKVAEYIRSNYDKSITNDTISAQFGYHSFYLNRVFKEHTGMTLHQAVIRERVTIAKRLLQNTDIAVEAISREAGFSDRIQFATTFRKYTGLTPSEYRNKKQKKNK
ncbi:MAG: AraC family transcriptional regulator [Ruminococcaceae bacterium]|nr:AraC family transcriptional regulator [Oscillospiraceae bacterium]